MAIKGKNMTGVKATCSETKRLGKGAKGRDRVDVYFDFYTREVFGVLLKKGSKHRETRNGVAYVTTYDRPATMKQIRADVFMNLAPQPGKRG